MMQRVAAAMVLAFVGIACSSAAPGSGQEGAAMAFELTSPAFEPGGSIPARHTCDGEDLSPELRWTDAPAGTRSFALICDDPDAPVGTWVHWVLYNVPADRRSLPEAVPGDGSLRDPDGAKHGRNDFRKLGYGGPCPPPGGPHRYFFKLYALDSAVALQPGATKTEVETAMRDHVLGEAQLMGTYARRR
jgi:Raf kinase inhibitor-like YbhB/YbcL family protein